MGGSTYAMVAQPICAFVGTLPEYFGMESISSQAYARTPAHTPAHFPAHTCSLLVVAMPANTSKTSYALRNINEQIESGETRSANPLVAIAI